ncbi:AraC family transcriptional regulator [Pseudomonas sp. GD03944]|uniref:helix-turn-helix transcriptional regulator n=1 Tax=Pseudomonas sp. GD03944 TaxID=2975409 RepID=UPI0024493441|nr:AraC family transcriptional regulator [Pseudomonas sp. GD03944]MDH1265234.1 AraC family transcriptional regulator [Pseudomonas sp. GD03944]HWV07974.1 AraC family transcriptional regulator [Pseudomonas sp.]
MSSQQVESVSLEPRIGTGHIRASAAEGAALQSAALFDGLVTIDHRRWACREAELSWSAPQHVVILTERGATATTHIRSSSTLTYEGRDRPGALSFVPAGVERSGYFRDADLIYTALWIDPALEFPGCPRLADLPMRVNSGDSIIHSLLSTLSMEMTGGHVPEASYLEHLVALVGLRLGRADTNEDNGRLGRALIIRLTDYIDARMEGSISLTELARIADMPVDTFARHFKAETGMAPYMYVIKRRIHRAESLLRNSTMPIVSMAFELGFSSQSHFTSTFKRLTGTTPNAYRQQADGILTRAT